MYQRRLSVFGDGARVTFRLFVGGASFSFPPAVMFTVGFERIDRLATKMAIGDPFEFWKFYVEAIGT